jgi:hypothetical protein
MRRDVPLASVQAATRLGGLVIWMLVAASVSSR